MNRQEDAKKLHHEGFNCAQSVLIASRDFTGLDQEVAAKVACGFGGGVRSGEICGCITGGVMALGCCSTQSETAPLVMRMVSDFREEHGCVRCAELQEKYGGKTKCDDMIAFGAELTARILRENGFKPLEEA